MWLERKTSATPYLLIHLAVADTILLFTFWFSNFSKIIIKVFKAWTGFGRVYAFPHSILSLVTTFAHLVGKSSLLYLKFCIIKH